MTVSLGGERGARRATDGTADQDNRPRPALAGRLPRRLRHLRAGALRALPRAADPRMAASRPAGAARHKPAGRADDAFHRRRRHGDDAGEEFLHAADLLRGDRVPGVLVLLLRLADRAGPLAPRHHRQRLDRRRLLHHHSRRHRLFRPDRRALHQVWPRHRRLPGSERLRSVPDLPLRRARAPHADAAVEQGDRKRIARARRLHRHLLLVLTRHLGPDLHHHDDWSAPSSSSWSGASRHACASSRSAPSGW